MRVSIVVVVLSVSYLVQGCANSFQVHAGYSAQAQRLFEGDSIQQRKEILNESRVRKDAIARFLNDGVTQ